jgi:hypothetical protein
MFPVLEGEIKQLDKNIMWNALSLLNFDPHIKQYKQEVQKILRFARHCKTTTECIH